MANPMISTADLCDHHADSVSVADPLFHPYGAVPSYCGKVATVKLHEDNAALRELLGTPGDGRVAVADVSAAYVAVVGDQLAALAIENGWAGILVNGYVRDTETLRDMAIGIHALGTCPCRSSVKAEGVRGEPVSFAGVTFTPGDYLYADRDGIIVSKEPLQ